MKKRLKQLPFRKKLLYFYLFLLFLFAGGIFVYTFQQAEHLMDLDREYMRQSNQQMNLTLEMVESNVKKLRYLHFSDESMRTMLMRPAENCSSQELFEAEEHIGSLLAAQTDLDPYLLRATIETKDGRIYRSLVSDDEAYLKRVQRTAGRQEWADRNQVVYTQVVTQKINMVEYETVTMISPLYDTVEAEPIGMLYVDLDFGKLKQELDSLRGDSENSAQFAILSTGEVLYHSADQREDPYPVDLNAGLLYRQLEKTARGEEKKDTLEIDQRMCSVSAVYNSETGWVLLQYRRNSAVYFEMIPDMMKVIGVLSVIWFALLAVGIFVVNQISRPVRLLSEVMGKAGQNRQGEVSVIDDRENVWEDEMGLLIRSYNEMAHRINENIIRSYAAELEQKRTELQMLQFQINPHFLYNALNTISSIAVLENVEHIPQIANSLSEMFRYNIKGSNIVSVRDEICQTRNYLNVQMVRFPERFDIRMDVPEEVLECRMVKFILQPVVENSIQHGFSEKRKRDCMKITGRKEENKICLCVEDDGVGMKPEKVRELNERFHESGTVYRLTENAKSIGLSNVNARIRYFYGEEYGIQVESSYGEFTRIILKFPAVLLQDVEGKDEDYCSG